MRTSRTGSDFIIAFRPKADRFDRAGGCIMRLAPVPMFFCNEPEEAIEKSAESSRTTHGAAACPDACRYLAALLIGALSGSSKEEILSSRYTPVPGFGTEGH